MHAQIVCMRPVQSGTRLLFSPVRPNPDVTATANLKHERTTCTQLPIALWSAPADFMVEPHTVRRRRPAHHTTSACHSNLCRLPDSHGQPLLTITVRQLPFANIAILPLPPTNCVAPATAGPGRSYQY